MVPAPPDPLTLLNPYCEDDIAWLAARWMTSIAGKSIAKRCLPEIVGQGSRCSLAGRGAEPRLP